MTTWNRRDILKTGLAASLGMAVPDMLSAAPGATGPGGPELGAADRAAGSGSTSAATSPRERLLLDSGWRFHLGHATDPAQDFGYGEGSAFAKSGHLFSVARPKFDDGTWQAVDLPHDWAVDLPFVDDKRLVDIGFKPLGRDYPATSVGWYRRAFDVPASDAGRRLSLEFDGVFRDAMFALNGDYLGRNLSGYVPARYDITDFVNYGGRNVLVVRVDATEHEGWFYEGAGIYRHVWLVKTDPVHVGHWGTFVSSDVKGTRATVRVATSVDNEGDAAADVIVRSDIHDAGGTMVSTARATPTRIGAGGTVDVEQHLDIARPALWSIETPHMYTLVTTIEVSGRVVDRYETPFGIRTIGFDAERGFFLNGKRVELKGTCNHQDHAGVGSALPDRLQSFRIETLKGMGANAYRTSHNPPTPELLDACDRLGMLVLDETRMFSSSEEGLSQFERMLRRDRNHPCIFAWSMENEEPEQGTEEGARVGLSMKRLARKLDPTRPVTGAMNNGYGKGISNIVDLQGFNYNLGAIDPFHAAHPKLPVFGSETASTVSTRGIYANDTERGYVSAYDVNAPPWASTSETWWSFYDARPWLAGGFAWTGFDYRGEPTPYAWPCINSHFGIVDTCGFPKDIYHYYRAWWGDVPALHLFPHWNWAGREGQEIDVWAFTNADEVELLLNGRSIGRQRVKRAGHAQWKVPYAPGAIVARAFTGGRQVLESVRETTGPAAKIVLRPDRVRVAADGEDVAVVRVEVADANGRTVPTADHAVTFAVSGEGRLLGVGNGDPSSHESDRGPGRRAFNGLCCAIVQATRRSGDIRIEASSPGLASAAVLVHAAAATPRPAVD